MTPEEFAGKVEWEGGLYEAIFSYGLGSEDLEDSELKDAIKSVESWAPDFIAAMEYAESLLEDLMEES